MDWDQILILFFFILALGALLALVLHRRLTRRSTFPSDAWEPYLAHDDADLEGAPAKVKEPSPEEGEGPPEPVPAPSAGASDEPREEETLQPGPLHLSPPELAPLSAGEEHTPPEESESPKSSRPPEGDGGGPFPRAPARREEEEEDVFSLLEGQEEGKGRQPRVRARALTERLIQGRRVEGEKEAATPPPPPAHSAGGDGGAGAAPRSEEASAPTAPPSPSTPEPARSPLDELDPLLKRLCPGGIPVIEEMEKEPPAAAAEVLKAATREARQRGEGVGANTSYQLGILSLLCREPSAATQHLKAALRRTHEFGPVLNSLGVAHFALGKGEAALSYLKEGLRESGQERELRIAILRNLARVYAHCRSPRSAAQCCREALDLLGPEEGGYLRARLLARHGRLCRELGEAEEARESLQEAFRLDRAQGRPGAAAASLSLLAQVHREAEEMEEALGSLKEALALWREAGDRSGEAHALGALGVVYAGREEFDRALECCEHARALHRELGDLKGEAADLGNIGNMFYFRGELDRALAAHEGALALNREAGHHRGVATSLGNLGRVKFELGSREEAGALLEEAFVLFRQEGAHPQVEKVRRILEEIRHLSPPRRGRGKRRKRA